MKRYLLDTCAISDSARLLPSPAMEAWLDEQIADNLYLSVITVAEIRQGITHIQGSARSRQYATWLNQHVLPAFASRLLAVDLAIAERWGDMRGAAMKMGRSLNLTDSLIAATALVHDMAIVTRNVADFAPTGVTVVNPWQA